MNRYSRRIFVVSVLFAAVLLLFPTTGASAATVDPNLRAPMAAAYSHTGAWTYDNATAVSYQNKLWFFMPGQDTIIHYQTWDGVNWSSIMHVIDSGGGTHYTYAQINPVVIDDYLYLFYTRLDGAIQVAKYNPWAVDPTDPTKYKPEWINMRKIPRWLYDVKGRFAAVYNYVNHYVEIYLTTNSTTIEMLQYSPDTNTYSIFNTYTFTDGWNVSAYLTAVFNGNETDGDYVTYLGWNIYQVVDEDRKNFDSYIGELKDGVAQITYWADGWGTSNLTDPAPKISLFDMTEQYLGLIYSSGEGGDWKSTWYEKYDKVLHEVDLYFRWPVPFTSHTAAHWVPNGVVYSTKVDDPDSPTGKRMDTRLYAIVENNPDDPGARWQFVECEFLGYWMPTGGPKTMDFGATSESFPLWPVLGLIDMPPFVRNGNPESLDKITSAELSFSQATTNGLSGEYSVGPYMESGKRSPVTFDVSAGYAGGFENSLTFKFTSINGIEENFEGSILAFYLAPNFKVYELEWHDSSGQPTGITTTALESLAPTIKQEAFDPEVGPDVAYDNGVPSFTPPYLDVAKTAAEINAYPAKFPMHASDDDRTRLSTYGRDPNALGFVNVFYDPNDPAIYQTTWSKYTHPSLGLSIDEDHSVDNGFYCDLKVGAEVAHAIGFGVQGSLKILVNTKTQKSVEAVTNFYSQNPIEEWTSNIPAVTSFDIYYYWLKPDASGYWVPRNRKGMGDTPWFITYRVPAVYPQSTISLPEQAMAMPLAASATPFLDSDPQQAMPIGIGSLASLGDTLRLHLGLNAFAGPVDLYFGIFAPDVDPLNMCILKSDLTFQPHTDGIIPWKANVTGSTSESLLGEIPAYKLPPSKYYIYLAATQAGKDFSSGYYLWSTQFEMGTEDEPWWWSLFGELEAAHIESVCDLFSSSSMQWPR